MTTSAGSLPVVASPPPPVWRSRAVHLGRWLIIGLLVVALRVANLQRQESASSARPVPELDAERLVQWFGPTAAEQPLDDDGRQRLVRSAEGDVLGRLIATLPEAAQVTGYKGPSDVLIGLDARRRIVGTHLLHSQDTIDHVQAIRDQPAFLEQFVGRQESAVTDDVDVVSGATLTSLAIRDAIALRLGATLPMSTRFPEPLQLGEARRWFPAATRLTPAGSGVATVHGRDGLSLGTIARTGVLEEHINGYQGPTELLLAFDPQPPQPPSADAAAVAPPAEEPAAADAPGPASTGPWLRAVAVRKSYDNQPYASYIDDEPWYWDPFLGRDWSQLAAADLEALRIEGVSGATMTSVAAAETLVAAAGEHQANLAAEQAAAPTGWWAAWRRVRWSANSVATVAILAGSMLLMWTPLRRWRRLRFAWQWVLILGLGLLTGNLLSLALMIGWAGSGVAWFLAPGLAAVLVVALGFAATSKSPYYCAQVCPHGALQQQLRGWLPRRFRWHPSPRTTTVLLQIPLVLLVAGYLVVFFGLPYDLSRWEPFDAYLWWTGAGGSVLLAIGSLVLATAHPMGYCRFGCPTGRLLGHLRRHRRSGRWTAADTVAAALCAAVWIVLATNA
ncbi:FMN-binding protein [Roseimaritima sediminicola]|uniref:FMN-binding protein n=1 Tax=Roseimaritima sediminicola TaxID=2662066 RepID=UPI00129856C8|nr:FMN-binding protein [Roseimaritima sediminicola]